MLVSLLVCLIPTTIGGLLSAIGIAGMDRVMQHNVLAMSGKAVEAAGDVNTLLLDKTGTITLGNRQAVEFIRSPKASPKRNWPTPRSFPAWPTKRRRAARSSCWRKRNTACAAAKSPQHEAHFHSVLGLHAHERRGYRRPPAAQRRDGSRSRSSSKEHGGTVPADFTGDVSDRISRTGGTPLAVADGPRAARHHSPEGHRQRRHEGAHRAAARDGHPHRS